MAALEWDTLGKRYFEVGVSNAILFVKNQNSAGYQSGVAWNGVISANDGLEGDDPEPLYDHGIPYFYSYGPVRPTINLTTYDYPDELLECLGYETDIDYTGFVKIPGQIRRPFGLAYKTKIGNDTDAQDHGYKLHIYYNCLITANEEKQYSTINSEVEPTEMNFTIYPSAFKMDVNGETKWVTHLVFDSRWFEGQSNCNLDNLFNVLSGVATGTPTLPDPDDIYDILCNPSND